MPADAYMGASVEKVTIVLQDVYKRQPLDNGRDQPGQPGGEYAVARWLEQSDR